MQFPSSLAQVEPGVSAAGVWQAAADEEEEEVRRRWGSRTFSRGCLYFAGAGAALAAEILKCYWLRWKLGTNEANTHLLSVDQFIGVFEILLQVQKYKQENKTIEDNDTWKYFIFAFLRKDRCN